MPIRETARLGPYPLPACRTITFFQRYGFRLLLLGIFTCVWLWSAWKPLHPDDWELENYLVFFWVPVLLITAHYFKLSDISYGLITLFMCLHVIGSHYTYSEVPFGGTLQIWLNAERNMYDRLVHFAFGLLLAYPIREVLIRIARLRGFWAYFFPINVTFYLIVNWSPVHAFIFIQFRKRIRTWLTPLASNPPWDETMPGGGTWPMKGNSAFNAVQIVKPCGTRRRRCAVNATASPGMRLQRAAIS